MHWLPYPCLDQQNPGHYKKFEDIYGLEESTASEDYVPSILNNIRKVSEEQQVNENLSLLRHYLSNHLREMVFALYKCKHYSSNTGFLSVFWNP